MRPFRFGLQAPRIHDGAAWLALARRVEREYIQTGIRFDPGKVRVGRFDEYRQVVKGLLGAREPYAFAGQWFTLDGYPPLPHLADFAPPPIVVGGGSRQVLSVAGR